MALQELRCNGFTGAEMVPSASKVTVIDPDVATNSQGDSCQDIYRP